MFFSRLEQFQILVFDLVLFVFSNSGLFLVFVLFGVLLLFQILKGFNMVPSYLQSLLESLILFLNSVISDQISKKGVALYGSFLFTLFVLILGCNLVGLIPYTFTITSHIAVTLGCSIGIFIGSVIIGLWIHQERFFDMFLPLGVPLFLQPALIYIEILGFVAKAFSLGVRLSANMLAGHTLLKLTSMLVWGIFISGGLIQPLFIFPFVGLVLLTGLEIVISFVQAYVFIVLTCSVLPNKILQI